MHTLLRGEKMDYEHIYLIFVDIIKRLLLNESSKERDK
jgi:hypothetical protein